MLRLEGKVAVISGRNDGIGLAIARRAALFLASDESAFMTGSDMTVDGGVSNL